ncbi:efflux RND transporter permease subunit [Portibacter lacus]|uniref:Copper transporter n=1 Tax=Portibacter lacus TaxID=1099794 RepID=A0AA37SNA1_9BACT|nr:efflux RND transporter permease subunit [Portibacter lacus]GLR16862.1 copper transporter [Portibacter lacus]
MSEKNKNLRTFGLTNLAVNNKISVFLLTGMIFIFGIISYVGMPKESFPEITFPQVFVNTPYFGNSAGDIENLITRPLEKELASISEIKNLTSSSMQDFSIITCEFETDIDIEFAKQKVKDAVDKAKSELPTDLTSDPEVLDINLSEIPIMSVNLSGDFPNDELRSYAEFLQDRFEDLSEISSVTLKGTLEREVQINVDIPLMQGLQVSFGDVENAVKSENMTMSGGEIVNNDFRRSIRVIGEFTDVSELENLIVKSENQKPIYLRDFAEVLFGYAEQTSIARSDKLPVVSLDIIKRAGENLLLASDKIKDIIDEAQMNSLPENLSVKVFNDQSVATRDLVSNLENSIISGVILVVLVLLFFLGLRNSTFVGIAIPLSMLMGIMILSFVGYTLNMVVLFSLILALGMLVDNAIVVVENIYRYYGEGYSKDDAAKYGTGEVALPIIASTATTLAAFVPLAFWPGLFGSFMKFLPITLIAVLTASLFIALVINPVLTSTFITKQEENVAKNKIRKNITYLVISLVSVAFIGLIGHLTGTIWLRNICIIIGGLMLINFLILKPASRVFQQSIMPFLENLYDRFIRLALYKFMPYLLFIGSFVLLFAAFAILGSNPPKVELFPSTDPNYVNVFVELPLGKDIEATNDIMKRIEENVERDMAKHTDVVDAILSQIGENTGDPNAGPSFGASPNQARLTVSFVPSDERGDKSTFDIMEQIRTSVQGIPGVKVSVDKEQSGPPQEKPVYIEITGEDIDQLAIQSESLIKFINQSSVAGIEELSADVKIGKPEMQINVDRKAARRYEISTFSIADVIRTAVFGKEISKYKQGEDEYPINLRAKESFRNSVGDILNQKITFRNPANGQIAQVPISAVADITYTSTYSAINRKDQERMITITSNVLQGFNANEVVESIRLVLEDYEMPEGYKFEFAGQQEQQAEEMSFLSGALGIAVFMIFLILVMQFNSIISPFIIILSVVFSLIGVLFGYIGSGMDILIIMTGVGVISLAGIVVNNAIVLVDYTNLMVQRKRESLGIDKMSNMAIEDIKEAIVKSGATRLRPVLLTAITTVLGLIPLAIGLNINFFTLITEFDPQYYVGGDSAAFWGTMAWTVIYGLVFSTFLTLVVVPVMYWLAFLMKRSTNRLFAKKKPKTV